MKTPVTIVVAFVLALGGLSGLAQEPQEPPAKPPSPEQQISALEQQLAAAVRKLGDAERDLGVLRQIQAAFVSKQLIDVAMCKAKVESASPEYVVDAATFKVSEKKPKTEKKPPS